MDVQALLAKSTEDLNVRIELLLKEAEQRLSRIAQTGPTEEHSSAVQISSAAEAQQRRQFGLIVPVLPAPYIKHKGVASKVDSGRFLLKAPRAEADGTKSNVVLSSKTKASKKPTAGGEWFDLPRTQVTDEFKKDMQLLRMRSVLDPKRHYKKEAVTKQNFLPEFSQMGTVIEGPTEFFSARIFKKDRKGTLLEETLSQTATVDRFKRKYAEILNSKRSGRTEHYRALKAKRQKSLRR